MSSIKEVVELIAVVAWIVTGLVFVVAANPKNRMANRFVPILGVVGIIASIAYAIIPVTTGASSDSDISKLEPNITGQVLRIEKVVTAKRFSGDPTTTFNFSIVARPTDLFMASADSFPFVSLTREDDSVSFSCCSEDSGVYKVTSFRNLTTQGPMPAEAVLPSP